MTVENTVNKEPESPAAGSYAAKTSKAAIWSLICGLLSFLCLPALPAIILGIVALVAISNNKGKLKGTGLAVAGIITAVLITLIMIPVIGVIAAIVIPNLVDTRAHTPPMDIWSVDEDGYREQDDEGASAEQISANEASAAAALKLVCNAEAVWRQQDPDGNGIKDYWTYDISCLHRMFRADGITKVAFIPIAAALADANTAEFGDFGETPLIEDWSKAALEPKSGYYFQAMETDESGVPYNLEAVGEAGIKATNKSKFGFVAYPAEYGRTGRRTFIVNEKGTVYAIDINPDIFGVALAWPGNDDADNPYAKSKWKVAD